MKSLKILALAICGILTAGMLTAQEPAAKPAPKSPPATATATLAGKAITITYSSPRVNGREGKIFTKDGLISKDPTFPIWRAGANGATTLKTDAELKIGDLVVPAGSYSLFIDLSDAEHWVLIINKQTGQWGTDYDKAQDLGRVPMRTGKSKALTEELTFKIDEEGKSEGKIVLLWENVKASANFIVK